ncbi:SusD/RagB family nutrient-binding outer membrane lipoprotein [Pedobacter mucosus]|uniref:SusD/RagB family nutrient-binding outer membrane lipoprotein n=1 Tax=Pedobacter mucosus TaxID=2895286 RepID=UPI001EE47A8B|nr:SusD/RagB family nutrient-binding outer membrane lipoprotein [Pedobacter mucosus]UKT63599.1 SusD/RagB family nutrient-binding outer membrane lipoprotein [Pedobacter mucosus]
MKNIYILFAAVATMISVSSCKKYLDVNTDPATPQDVESKTLTPPLFSQMARGVAYDARYLGPVIQNWGYRTTGYVGDIHGWILSSDAMGEIWRTNYFGLGANLNLIMDDATKTQQWNYLGLAQSLKAWGWQITTDYHGDIILKQAYEPNRFVFDYDPQQDVYAEVVKVANEAIASWSRTDGNGTVAKIAASDLIYAGDASKWIKFNYGLLALNLNNQINKASYNPAKVIEYVDKSLASNADNFLVPHLGTNTTNANFFGPIRGNLNSFRNSRMMVGLLNGAYLNGVPGSVMDPRISTLITASTDGQYRGTIAGMGDPASTAAALPTAIPNPWGSIAINSGTPTPGAGGGKYLFKDNSPAPVMTYPEMQFVKAEAAFRMGNVSLAYTAYLNGINGSLDFVSGLGTVITTAQRTAYLTSTSVKQSAATLTLKDIMLQKYIAMYGYCFVETWCDLRKYNYADGDTMGNNPYVNTFILPTTLFSDNGGKPAQRYRPRYNSEYLWNLSALKKIGGDMPDYHTYKMWFSQP